VVDYTNVESRILADFLIFLAVSRTDDSGYLNIINRDGIRMSRNRRIARLLDGNSLIVTAGSLHTQPGRSRPGYSLTIAFG